MDIYNTLIYFIAGGATVTAAVLLSEVGSPILSGLAILFPGITVISYYFIGKSMGVTAASASINSTVVSSIIVWLPYMITLAYLTPKIGVNKAILYSIAVFLIIGVVWVYVNNKYQFV